MNDEFYFGVTHGPRSEDTNDFICKDGRKPGLIGVRLSDTYQTYNAGDLYETSEIIGTIGSDINITYGDYKDGLVDTKIRGKLIPSMIHIYLIPNFNQPYISVSKPKTMELQGGKMVPKYTKTLYDTYTRGPIKKPNTKYLTTRMAIGLINSKLPIVLDLRSKSYRDVIIVYR